MNDKNNREIDISRKTINNNIIKKAKEINKLKLEIDKLVKELINLNERNKHK